MLLLSIFAWLVVLESCGSFSSCRTMFVRRSVRLFSSASRAEIHQQGRVSAAVLNVDNTGGSCKVTGKGVFVTSPPKGTRDFYPDECRVRTWLHNKWKDTSDKFGFEPYDAPILESEDLYVRKAGEEITQQLYNFKDKGGRQLSLRPEMTPSLARMVLAKGKAIQLPLKWCSIPQCWRYERMARGRRREHYQWNMDIWGVPGVGAEAELLAAVVSCFQSLGLSDTDVGIKINNRKLLNAVMNHVGISEDLWVPACVLIDKLDKQTPASLAPEFAALGLDESTVDQLLQHLQLKSLDEFAALLGEDCEGVREVRRLMDLLLHGYGVSAGWVEFNCSVVRGLAYYTGTVFEGFDKKGQLRAICGGGRYDSLLSSMGASQSIPAVGFGFGDAVIMELLESLDLLPELEGPTAAPTVDVVVYTMEESLRTKALSLATQLRQQEALRVDVILDERKPKWALQRADRSRAPVLLMLAGEEHGRGQVVVKNLKQRSQATVAYENFAATVRETLNVATSSGEEIKR